MAHEIWLGPAGTEVLLPPVTWISGSPGEYPESLKKNFDSATMIDGRIRYDFKPFSQRSWTLSWALLTKDKIDALQALADLRQTLRFKSGLTADPEWTMAAVASFVFAPVAQTFIQLKVQYYRAAMSLEESNG